MLELIYKNDYVKVSGQSSRDIISLIVDGCSYVVPAAEWSEKYQTGSWDGKISLFNRRTQMFPSGLLSVVEGILTDAKISYKIVDERLIPIKANLCKVDLGPHEFRDYQTLAIQKIAENKRGILAMCTGAGKTKTSAGIISDLSVFPVLFIVPSYSLLKQTVADFKDTLKPIDKDFGIGEIGGGECIIFENGVNVATYHTALGAFDLKYSDQKKKIIDVEEDKNSLESLNKQLVIFEVDYQNSPKSKLKAIETKIKKLKKKILDKQEFLKNKAKIRDLVQRCQLLIIDETHIAAEIIENISIKSTNAYYKCGLSATPNRTDGADLRMFGATGPVIYKVSASELIKKGFLVKPYIYTIDLDFIDKTSISYQETYKNAIVLSEPRNNLIKTLAEMSHEDGRPTLILVERLEHGNLLEELIKDALFVPGKDSGNSDEKITDEELNYRRRQLNRMENNEIILIGTQWINLGVDAPKISCLILAGSCSSPVTTIQQVGRGLRKAAGKKDCIIFDFKHKEKNLRNHCYSRIKAYKTEPEFEVKTLKYNINKGTYV